MFYKGIKQLLSVLRKQIFFFSLLITAVPSSLLFAEEPLKVAISYFHPPYCFENGTGIRTEIISSILDRLDKTYNFQSFSLNRSRCAIETLGMDISLVARKGVGNAYFSDPYIYYSNVAVSLKKNNLEIKTIADLKNYTVYAWQGANKALGEDFARLFDDMDKRYHELPRPTILPKLLLLERADVVLIDKFVFKYIWNELSQERPFMPEVSYHDTLFPRRTYFYASFKKQDLRDAFNRELKKFKKEGRIQQIYKKHVPNISKEDLVW